MSKEVWSVPARILLRCRGMNDDERFTLQVNGCDAATLHTLHTAWWGLTLETL